MTAKKQKHIIFEKGTGNVFADIGFANSEREQLKAHLTLQIYRIFKDRHLTQAQAGASEYGRVTNPICRRHFVEQFVRRSSVGKSVPAAFEVLHAVSPLIFLPPGRF